MQEKKKVIYFVKIENFGINIMILNKLQSVSFVFFCPCFSAIVGDDDSQGISTIDFNPLEFLIVVILGYGSSLPLSVRLMTGQQRS